MSQIRPLTAYGDHLNQKETVKIIDLFEQDIWHCVEVWACTGTTTCRSWTASQDPDMLSSQTQVSSFPGCVHLNMILGKWFYTTLLEQATGQGDLQRFLPMLSLLRSCDSSWWGCHKSQLFHFLKDKEQCLEEYPPIFQLFISGKAVSTKLFSEKLIYWYAGLTLSKERGID